MVSCKISSYESNLLRTFTVIIRNKMVIAMQFLVAFLTGKIFSETLSMLFGSGFLPRFIILEQILDVLYNSFCGLELSIEP